jgi:hypothetical protein
VSKRNTRDIDEERLKKAADELLDQFDSVEIVATRHEGCEAGTVNFSHGVGNWYSRYASLQEVLIKMRRLMAQEDD